MLSPVIRVYGTEQQANDAIARLKEYGFPEAVILAVRPVAEGPGDADEALRGAVEAGFVPQELAQRYTALLRQGQCLVAVCPPFGRGQVAIDILDDFKPMATGLEHHRGPALWDVAAPLSSGLRAPVLWHGQPAPFSRITGGQILLRGRTFGDKRPELTRSDWSFSSAMGMRLLSRRQAPWSSLAGKAGPSWSRSLGFPMLTSSPTPFSSSLGLGFLAGPLRFDQAAPFSEMLGLRTLKPGRSVLSRVLGELGSPHFAIFGRGPLSSEAAPFSRLIAQPLLWENPAPFSARIGQPTLREGGTPLSSALTMPSLWRVPTPLSSLLRLPLLSRYQ